MKYKKIDEKVLINYLVLIKRGLCKNQLGFVIKKYKNNIIRVKCINNGIECIFSIGAFYFVEHLEGKNLKSYRMLANKLQEDFDKKYRNIYYIKNNFMSDPIMFNDITCETLNEYYKVDCFNISTLIKYKDDILNVFLMGGSMRNMLFNKDLIFEI